MLGLIKSVFSFFASIGKFFSDKQLIDAGRSKEEAISTESALGKIISSIIARRSARRVPNDKNDRDRR